MQLRMYYVIFLSGEAEKKGVTCKQKEECCLSTWDWRTKTKPQVCSSWETEAVYEKTLILELWRIRMLLY